MTTDPNAWMKDARCRGMDPNLFVPEFNPTTRQGPAKEALACCDGDGSAWNGPCPVRARCLEYGKENRATGCFGGRALYDGKIRRKRR
jgi:hypothetical protein